MKWINIEDRLPMRWERVIFYKSYGVGGYDKGIYIGHLQENGYIDQFIVVIDDLSGFGNNKRLLSEFSHWMPLPEIPEECLI